MRDAVKERYGTDKYATLLRQMVEDALDRLAVRPSPDDPAVLLPEFEPLRERQRDHTAEAAGY